MSTTLPAVKMTRTINAPVAKVLEAWTNVARLKRWLAPHPYKVLEPAADARPGGRYGIVVATEDDGAHATDDSGQ
jgi:uncharacterized protein YndB with AHSA1/START domain